MPTLQILFNLTSLLTGFVFGSFINVIVYRLPQNISIIKPRSSCPECNRIIPWQENIPILSWFLLKGKCSGCNSSISVRYPLIETFTGILFLGTFGAMLCQGIFGSNFFNHLEKLSIFFLCFMAYWCIT